MKLFVLLGLIISSVAFSNTFDSRQFYFNGTNLSEEVNLSTEVTKTVYENRVVRSTCYRRDVRRQCRRVCQNNRCRNVCRNVVVRRPYTCYINRTVPVQIFDYENISKSTFNFENEGTFGDLGETFVVTQRGSKTGVEVKGSGNYLVRLKKNFEDIQREQGVRYVTTDYTVSFTDISLAKKVLSNGIKGVKLKRNILTFNVGSGFDLNFFNFNLKLFRNRSLASDILLFNRDVRDLAILRDNGFLTEVTIDLSKLGVNLPSKKRIIVDIDYIVDTYGALNSKDVKLKTSANWKFK